MTVFEYSALDTGGRTARGLAEGESDRQIRRQLRERGLIPVAVVETQKGQDRLPGRRRPFGPRLNADKLALFTRLLGTLLGSGMPLDDALTALAKQGGDPALARIVLDVRAKVLEGHPLETGLAQFPGAFPEAYRATVGAGEQTRHLPLVLQRLADYVEQRRQLQSRIRLALIYPGVLTGTALLVVAALLTYVVPEVVKIFEHMNRELPAITRGLIATSHAFQRFGLPAAALGVALVFAARFIFRNEGPRLRLHAVLLRIPILAHLIREANAARLARTLGILLGSGVEMLDALHIAAKSLTSLPIANGVLAASTKVREGESLATALERAPGIPPLLLHLIASGEASGELTLMLDTAAQSHERNVQSAVAVLLGLAEPALILCMGAAVLTIVIAILLPIFEINRLV